MPPLDGNPQSLLVWGISIFFSSLVAALSLRLACFAFNHFAGPRRARTPDETAGPAPRRFVPPMSYDQPAPPIEPLVDAIEVPGFPWVFALCVATYLATLSSLLLAIVVLPHLTKEAPSIWVLLSIAFVVHSVAIFTACKAALRPPGKSRRASRSSIY